jgi:hypothetical protein
MGPSPLLDPFFSMVCGKPARQIFPNKGVNLQISANKRLSIECRPAMEIASGILLLIKDSDLSEITCKSG